MIRHKKKVLANRPDGVDATLVRGLSDWDDVHVAPDVLAYFLTAPSALTVIMPGKSRPDTEIPYTRSKFDFTYADQARVIVGCAYGSAKIFFKYSTDLAIWRALDGVGGPVIQQTQGNANPTVYASPWVNIEANAKADRWIAAFYRENTDVSIVQISALWLQVR